MGWFVLPTNWYSNDKRCVNCKHFVEGGICSVTKQYINENAYCVTTKYKIKIKEITEGMIIDTISYPVVLVNTEKPKLNIFEPIFPYEEK